VQRFRIEPLGEQADEDVAPANTVEQGGTVEPSSVSDCPMMTSAPLSRRTRSPASGMRRDTKIRSAMRAKIVG